MNLYVRIVLFAFKKYAKDGCFLSAAGLAFYTILTLVPLTMLALEVGQFFHLELSLDAMLQEYIPQAKNLIADFISYSKTLISQQEHIIIVVVSVLLTFSGGFYLLVGLEHSFNHIWAVKRHRKFLKKLGYYLSVLMLAPFVLAFSSALTFFVTGVKYSSLGNFWIFSPALLVLAQLLPFVLVCVLFLWMNFFIPYRKVPLSAAFIGAIVSGVLYQIVQWYHYFFQYGSSQLGIIYGSLTSIILFFIALQLSWTIILLGAEFAFSFAFFKRRT